MGSFLPSPYMHVAYLGTHLPMSKPGLSDGVLHSTGAQVLPHQIHNLKVRGTLFKVLVSSPVCLLLHSWIASAAHRCLHMHSCTDVALPLKPLNIGWAAVEDPHTPTLEKADK
jgi:hypothetical protein